MKRFVTTFLSFALLASGTAVAQAPQAPPNNGGMKVIRSGSVPSTKGPDGLFIGTVRLDPLFPAAPPSNVSGAYVTFEPGARTNWHVHPAAQMLIVTAGTGWVEEWGHPVQEVHAGDTVVIPAGVKHWHGATATTAMTHIAISQTIDGKLVDVGEPVSAEQYRLAP